MPTRLLQPRSRGTSAHDARCTLRATAAFLLALTKLSDSHRLIHKVGATHIGLDLTPPVWAAFLEKPCALTEGTPGHPTQERHR